jgi:hypothetical protein
MVGWLVRGSQLQVAKPGGHDEYRSAVERIRMKWVMLRPGLRWARPAAMAMPTSVYSESRSPGARSWWSGAGGQTEARRGFLPAWFSSVP